MNFLRELLNEFEKGVIILSLIKSIISHVCLFMVISHVSIIMKVLFTIRVYGVCWAANMFDWKSKIYFSR